MWAAALFASLICLAGCGREGVRDVPVITGRIDDFSCRLRLTGQQSMNSYENFRRLSKVEQHLTCPFDYRSAKVVTIFVKRVAGHCNGIGPVGYSILESGAADRGGGFRLCSDAFTGFDNKKLSDLDVDSYIWVPNNQDFSVPRSAGDLSVRLKMVSAAAGLPFIDDNMSNVGLCWEERSGTNLSPAALFSTLDVETPTWGEERKFTGKTCAQTIDVVAADARAKE